ncbi:hypothetical protein ACQRKX_004738, partial [Enterobacter cloacae]
TAPARCGEETQHVPLPQLLMTLYVVFRTLIVTCCPAADIAALLIPSPWYTSGKSKYARKSDLTGTTIQ